MADYDPRNIKEYFGKTFVTNSGTAYTITADGRILGKQGVEGAKIEMLVGIPLKDDLYKKVMVGMFPEDPKCKSKLKEIIEKEGRAPVKGLRLLVCLTDESTKETKMNGFLTPVITKVSDAEKK